MTKNRKQKKSVRAQALADGTNYTSALRGGDAQPDSGGDSLLSSQGILASALARAVDPLSSAAEADAAARFGSAAMDTMIDSLIVSLTQTATPTDDVAWTQMLVAFAFTDPCPEWDEEAGEVVGEYGWHEGVPAVAIWWSDEEWAYNVAEQVEDMEDVTARLDASVTDLLAIVAVERARVEVEWNLLAFRLVPEPGNVVRTTVVPYVEFEPAKKISDAATMKQLLGGNIHAT